MEDGLSTQKVFCEGKMVSVIKSFGEMRIRS